MLVREMLSWLDAIHFSEMTNQNWERGVLSKDGMDESRVHGPGNVSYRSRCETWIERSFWKPGRGQNGIVSAKGLAIPQILCVAESKRGRAYFVPASGSALKAGLDPQARLHCYSGRAIRPSTWK